MIYNVLSIQCKFLPLHCYHPTTFHEEWNNCMFLTKVRVKHVTFSLMAIYLKVMYFHRTAIIAKNYIQHACATKSLLCEISSTCFHTTLKIKGSPNNLEWASSSHLVWVGVLPPSPPLFINDPLDIQ